jgi:dUTP pyrophosphatase
MKEVELTHGLAAPTTPLVVRVRPLRHEWGGYVPQRSHFDDAGADLFACEDAIIPAQGWKAVHTGITIEIPHGYVGLVHPRSGMAFNHGVSVLNAPGTIDSGYRGEVMVALFNTSNRHFEVRGGFRIAQLVVQKVELPTFKWVENLSENDRGQNGFGSTGA